MFGMWTKWFNIIRKSLNPLFYLSIVCGLGSCRGSLTASGKCSSCGSQGDLEMKKEEILRLEKRLEELRLVCASIRSCRLDSMNGLGPLWIQTIKMTKISQILKKLKNSGAGKFSVLNSDFSFLTLFTF